MQLRGSKVLVTGASGGLGEAIARRLSQEGVELVLTARRAQVLESLASELGAEILVADLSDREDQERVNEAALKCDGVVANAGIGDEPDFSIDPVAAAAQVDRVIEVNLRAPIVLARTFAAARLAEGRPGAIVLVGSLSGMTATPSTSMYCATKFGLRGFSLSLAQELHSSGVTCSLVAPGFISDAGMHHDSGMELPSIVRKKKPLDVADAVVEGLTRAPIEVFVAPVELRATSMIASAAPVISSAVFRRAGAAQIAASKRS